jgi:hypothetical protein
MLKNVALWLIWRISRARLSGGYKRVTLNPMNTRYMVALRCVHSPALVETPAGDYKRVSSVAVSSVTWSWLGDSENKVITITPSSCFTTMSRWKNFPVASIVEVMIGLNSMDLTL